MTYQEKLQNVRWKIKRNRVIQKDNHECRFCQLQNKSNHVHHGYYEKGLEPWEYEDESLWTLCERHHKQIHEWLQELQRVIGHYPPEYIPHITDVLIEKLNEIYEFNG